MPLLPSGFSPRDALKTTGLLVVFMLGIGILVSLPFGFVQGFTKAAHLATPAWADIHSPALLVIANTIAFALCLRHALRKTGDSWRNVISSRPTRAAAVLALLLALAGLVIIASEVSNLVHRVAPPPDWARRGLRQLHDLADYPISAPISLLLVAPITEELFFRGFILRRLLASLSAPRAIVLSAVLFMAIHINPWQFPSALLAGILLGWVYARTRSLWLCLSAHSLFNGCTLLAAGFPFVVRGFNTPDPTGHAAFQPWWFDALGVALLSAGLLALHRLMPPLDPRPVIPEPPLASPQEAASAPVSG